MSMDSTLAAIAVSAGILYAAGIPQHAVAGLDATGVNGPQADAQYAHSMPDQTGNILADQTAPFLRVFGRMGWWWDNLDPTAQDPRIVLELDATSPLPHGFAPTKVFLCPGGTTLLYAQASRRFLILNSRFRLLADGTIPDTLDPVALIVTPSGQLELVTRDPPYIALVSTDGELIHRTRLAIVDGQIIGATFAPDVGWAAVFKMANSSYSIGIQHPDSSHWTFTQVDSLSISAESPVHITMTENAVFVAEAYTPHDVYIRAPRKIAF